ncbi:hypothetical protein GCM10025734_00730 [Kitasatospora paranensis]
MNLGHILYRSLTYWEKQTDGSTKLVGDLSTDAGTPSDDAKTWTFHLNKGIKWQDGTEVTSADVKYGVERSFDPDLAGGATYGQQWLVGGNGYKGPKQGELASIRTPDPYTIVFKLNRSVSDFNQATAIGTFAAVPKAHDTGATYDTHVWSDGPYMIGTYTRGKELTLVRNPHWSAGTDRLREQNVDRINVKIGLDGSAIDQLMKTDGSDAHTAVSGQTVASTDLQTFSSDPQLRSRFHSIASSPSTTWRSTPPPSPISRFARRSGTRSTSRPCAAASAARPTATTPPPSSTRRSLAASPPPPTVPTPQATRPRPSSCSPSPARRTSPSPLPSCRRRSATPSTTRWLRWASRST